MYHSLIICIFTQKGNLLAAAPAHPRGKRITPGVFPELHMPTETEPDNEEQVPQNIKRRYNL